MDDPTGRDLGYTPTQYAFMLLRAAPVGDSMEAPTSAVDATRVMVAATRDYCPRHAADLPQRWLATSIPASPATAVTVGALNLSTAISHAKDSFSRTIPDKSPDAAWANIIETTNAYVNEPNRPGAVDYLKEWTGSERTAAPLVDCMSQGIVAAPPQVQTAIDAI